MKTNPFAEKRRRNGRRGSTFILVLAILSILVLVAATLSYTARLEELAARNFADGIQARMSAQTGVGSVLSLFDGRTSGLVSAWTPPSGHLQGLGPQQPSLPYGPQQAAGPYGKQSRGPQGAQGIVPGARPGPGTGPSAMAPAPAQAPPAGPISPAMQGGLYPGSRQKGPGWVPAVTVTPPNYTAQIATGTLPAESGVFGDHRSRIETRLSQIRVEDESSLININELGSWAEFSRASRAGAAGLANPGTDPAGLPQTNMAYGALAQPPIRLADALYAILNSPEVNYRGASQAMAENLARAILRYRYGPDGQPGRAGYDDDGDSFGGGMMQTFETTAAGDPAPWPRALGGQLSGKSAGAQREVLARATSGLRDPVSANVESAPQPIPAGLPPFRLAANANADGQDNDFDGTIDEDNEGIDEPDEFVADPRLKPYGDDRPFRRIEELQRVEGMTPDLYLALRPYVTCFSVSEERVGPERDDRVPLDLNLATDWQIYERLLQAFPGVPPEVCAQFAANVADYRDSDSIPRQFQVPGRPEPILGLEVTPYITEVWPQAAGDPMESDDGQYLEIHNPYDVPLTLDGWSLRIGSGYSTVRLRGHLPPGAFAIVTDDYNESRDPTPEDDFSGYGSFYDIFRMVPSGEGRVLIEDPQFNLPDQSGVVELYDAQDNLIDVFSYGGQVVVGTRRSFQRLDPRIRIVSLEGCTPFTALTQSVDRQGIASPLRRLESARVRNAPFRSAFELFAIGVPATELQSGRNNVYWRTPRIGGLEPMGLNERLADEFTVNPNPRQPRPRMEAVAAAPVAAESAYDFGAPFAAGNPYAPRNAPASIPPVGGSGPSDMTTGLSLEAAPTSVTRCGRININTAPPPVLDALPGITDAQIEYLLAQRVQTPWINHVGIPMVYGCWSELLADEGFWQGVDSAQRLATAALWQRTVAFNSRTFRIVSENVPTPDSGPRLASRARVEAVVALDGKQNQVVTWRFLK